MEIKTNPAKEQTFFKNLKPGTTFREAEGAYELLLKTDEGDAVALDDGCIYKDYEGEISVVVVNGYFQET